MDYSYFVKDAYGAMNTRDLFKNQIVFLKVIKITDTLN